MWKCIICGRQHDEAAMSFKCGLKRSRDVISLRTLAPASSADKDYIRLRRTEYVLNMTQIWQNQQAEELKELRAREQQQAEAKRQAEEKRKAEEQRQAEEKRKAEEKRLAEEKKQAEAKRQAEEKRKAEEQRQAEAKRQAELKKQAEEKRLAEEKRKAEEQQQAALKQQEEQQQAAGQQNGPGCGSCLSYFAGIFCLCLGIAAIAGKEDIPVWGIILLFALFILFIALPGALSKTNKKQ